VSARASAPERDRDYSNRIRPSYAVLAAALLAAALLVAADLTTVIRVPGAAQPALSGHSQHDWAVLLLGLGVAVLGAWACWLRSRLAMAGIAVIGVAVLVIALAKDAPNIGVTGTVNARLQQGTTTAGPGFYLETAGAVVTIATGAFALIFGAGLPAPRRGGALKD
jgi:MFS superfamily sulfate permease-like transporter